MELEIRQCKTDLLRAALNLFLLLVLLGVAVLRVRPPVDGEAEQARVPQRGAVQVGEPRAVLGEL